MQILESRFRSEGLDDGSEIAVGPSFIYETRIYFC